MWCRNIKQQCYGLFFVFAAKIAFRLVMRDVITSHTNCIQLYYSTRTLMLIFFYCAQAGRMKEKCREQKGEENHVAPLAFLYQFYNK